MEVIDFMKRQDDKNEADLGLCPPPTTNQDALNVLTNHFLGKDWYVAMPLNTEQVNTIAVCEILNRHKIGWFKKFITNVFS